MVDQHIHSTFSPDSNVEIEEYIRAMRLHGNEYITLTDHFDYLLNLRKYDSYNYEKNMEVQYHYVNFLDEQVYSGIEVGYNTNVHSRIESFLNAHDFSLILLSIHDNDLLEIRYCQPTKTDLTIHEVVVTYFEQMFEAISSGVDFDVLSHIGYIFRYTNNQVNPLDYLDYVRKVLIKLIEIDKALELNSGCFRRKTYDAEGFYSEVLKLYASLGGKKVSLGSDAHQASDYCALFDKLIYILKTHGFNYATVIKNRQHSFVSL